MAEERYLEGKKKSVEQEEDHSPPPRRRETLYRGRERHSETKEKLGEQYGSPLQGRRHGREGGGGSGRYHPPSPPKERDMKREVDRRCSPNHPPYRDRRHSPPPFIKIDPSFRKRDRERAYKRSLRPSPPLHLDRRHSPPPRANGSRRSPSPSLYHDRRHSPLPRAYRRRPSSSPPLHLDRRHSPLLRANRSRRSPSRPLYHDRRHSPLPRAYRRPSPSPPLHLDRRHSPPLRANRSRRSPSPLLYHDRRHSPLPRAYRRRRSPSSPLYCDRRPSPPQIKRPRRDDGYDGRRTSPIGGGGLGHDSTRTCRYCGRCGHMPTDCPEEPTTITAESSYDTALRIDSLPPFAEEAVLMKLFCRAGHVYQLYLLRDENTGKCTGFALIYFIYKWEARNAIKMYNNICYPGSNIGMGVKWSSDCQ